MVARYLDASALAKRYIREPGTSTVARLLKADLLCTSRFTEVEIVSAVARREREGALTAAERERIIRALTDDLGNLLIVEIRDKVVGRARDLLLHHRLRSADAVHLASCLLLRDELVIEPTFIAYDGRLREAATAEGLDVLPRRIPPWRKGRWRERHAH